MWQCTRWRCRVQKLNWCVVLISASPKWNTGVNTCCLPYSPSPTRHMPFSPQSCPLGHALERVLTLQGVWACKSVRTRPWQVEWPRSCSKTRMSDGTKIGVFNARTTAAKHQPKPHRKPVSMPWVAGRPAFLPSSGVTTQRCLA